MTSILRKPRQEGQTNSLILSTARGALQSFIPFSRDQAFLLPPDVKAWIPADDLAHFIIAAAERVPIGAFQTGTQPGGKPQCHPRLMLALLVFSYANGIFSSRRITHRDIAVRFVAANLHPDHDTIARRLPHHQQGRLRGLPANPAAGP